MGANSYLITLSLVVIMFAVLSSYKIETFIDGVNFSQTSVAKDIPKDPNDFSCYRYIKSYKPWKIDTYSERMRRMISAMRTGLRYRKSDLSHTNPYNESCVVPKETMHLVGIDNNCRIGAHKLKQSDEDNTIPEGCVIDLRNDYKSEERFRSLLEHMDSAFNDKYIRRINELKAEIAMLKRRRDHMKKINDGLGTKLYKEEFDFKNKCDKELIDQLKESFHYKRKRIRDKTEEEYVEVDQFLIDKFGGLACNANNEYLTTKKRYDQELENYNKMQFWKKWYDSWYTWLADWSAAIDEDIEYYKGIVEHYAKWWT